MYGCWYILLVFSAMFELCRLRSYMLPHPLCELCVPGAVCDMLRCTSLLYCDACLLFYRYCSQWKGSLVLYCGKYGLLEKLGE